MEYKLVANAVTEGNLVTKQVSNPTVVDGNSEWRVVRVEYLFAHRWRQADYNYKAIEPKAATAIVLGDVYQQESG